MSARIASLRILRSLPSRARHAARAAFPRSIRKGSSCIAFGASHPIRNVPSCIRSRAIRTPLPIVRHRERIQTLSSLSSPSRKMASLLPFPVLSSSMSSSPVTRTRKQDRLKSTLSRASSRRFTSQLRNVMYLSLPPFTKGIHGMPRFRTS